jgi:PIN domain nuclease of toxin-antitoxin system
MKLLLDTHALLWEIAGDTRLRPHVRDAFRHAENSLFLSMASLWEISTKLANGRLRLPTQDIDYILSWMERWQVELLPVCVEHVRVASKLPFHHGDPFDRMLIAQANVEGFRFVSSDSKVRLYQVDIFWE